MDNREDNFSIVSTNRLEKLLEEADTELNKIQPQIDYLEECVEKLHDLKLKKQKLLSLKASVKTLVNNSDTTYNYVRNNKDRLNPDIITAVKSHLNITDKTNADLTSAQNFFVPELALNQVKSYLRTNNNLNFEIFKAVTYNGGHATTDQIREYLIKNKIKMPKTGKYFDEVELKEVSSRANYLVRKQLLISTSPGNFQATLGYTTS
jgi:hypothetical protein